MNANDEQLLERFFSSARRAALPDDGFSRRVMRRLPDRPLRLSRLWTAFCTLLGVALCVGWGVWARLAGYAAGALRTLMSVEVSPPAVANVLTGLALVALLAVAEAVDRLRCRW